MHDNRVLLRVAFAGFLFWAASTSAQPPNESCAQCKFADCLKGTIAQKEAMAALYDRLAAKWERFVLEDGAPIDEVNFLSLIDEGERSGFFVDVMKKIDVYQQEAETMSAEVPAAADCASGPGGPNQVATDTFERCTTGPELAAAQAAAPCREIAELLDAHEGLHRDACRRRKEAGDYWKYTAVTADGSSAEKYFPSRMHTPAGNAREEAAAYRFEISELKKIAERANRGCRLTFSGVTTTSCVMNQGGVRVEMGQILSGEVCGDPLTATWTIESSSWVRAPHVGYQVYEDPPFDSDCVARGSEEERTRERIYTAGPGGGWMCVFAAEPEPQVTIRLFRVAACEPPREVSYEALVERSTEPCS